MAKTKAQTGRASRNKGKRFERACREVMWDITGWQYWKRTQRGDKQWQGDLVACHENGTGLTPLESVEGGTYYVECRARGLLTAGIIAKWVDEVRDKAIDVSAASLWVLLCKQDRGPILAVCSWEQQLGETLKARIY